MLVKSIVVCYKHSAILSTLIKLPPVFKTFVLSIFEWPLETVKIQLALETVKIQLEGSLAIEQNMKRLTTEFY